MIKSGSATILSPTTRLQGDLETDEEVFLAGTFQGVLRTSKSVHVAASGRVQGEIHADAVLVVGQVTGPIHALDRIELQAGAVVDGDLAAQRVRIHDDVVFNGHCRITGPEAGRRQYLLPAVVQAFGTAPATDLARAESAATSFLAEMGFEVEVRPERGNDSAQVLRPIFRSRDQLAFSNLREKLRAVEQVLQSATLPDNGRERRFGGFLRKGDKDAEPLQTTGAEGARALVEALQGLRNGAVLLGPVAVTRLEDERGPALHVRVRQDYMPAESGIAAPPEPSALLVSIQKVQGEIIRELGSAIAARAQARGDAVREA